MALNNSGITGTSAPVVITVNQVPLVNAGVDQMIIWPANQVTLAGTASDDGRPTNGTFSSVWSVASGPGTVMFGNSITPITTATFSTNGTYTLRLTASDGAASPFDDVQVTINRRPIVSITSPTDGAISNAPTNLYIEAAATDLDGSVINVSFYAGVDLLAMDTISSPNYSTVWTNPAAGIYVLTVVATDDSGLASISSPVTVTVRQAPTVSIVTPTQGQNFTALANVGLSAVAGDVDGHVTKVEYFTNGLKFGEALTSPYLLPWKDVLGNPPGGSYTLMARATDNHGLTNDSASVTFTNARRVPIVSLGSPAPNTTNAAGQPILLLADAFDFDGQITNVQFFHNVTNLIAQRPSEPFQFLWTNAPSGSWTLQAKAYDNDGLVGASLLLTNFVAACAPALIQSLTLNPTQAIGGESISVTIALNAPAMEGGQTYLITEVVNPGTNVVPTQIHITSGQTSGTSSLRTIFTSVSNLTSIKASYRDQEDEKPLIILPKQGGGSDLPFCGPMDVAFVVDVTQSMSGAISNITNGLVGLLDRIEAASVGDYRLALVTFRDNVIVNEAFSSGNRTSIQSKLSALVASDGGRWAEASDEALNTVVRVLPALAARQ